MGLETASFVNQLIPTNPLDSDQRSTASAHLRLIKGALLGSFPNIGAVVNANAADLNVLTGLGATPTLVTPIPSGTFCTFLQATAPVGWTLVTTLNDMLIRVTNGTSGGAGGATGGSWTTTAVSVNSHTLVASELPSHTHNFSIVEKDSLAAGAGLANGGGNTSAYNGTTDNGTGGNQGHTHGVTVNPAWRPAYVNAIVCQKN